MYDMIINESVKLLPLSVHYCVPWYKYTVLSYNSVSCSSWFAVASSRGV